jgi:hypothetical protein
VRLDDQVVLRGDGDGDVRVEQVAGVRPHRPVTARTTS